jgi:hypothetical protein
MPELSESDPRDCNECEKLQNRSEQKQLPCWLGSCIHYYSSSENRSSMLLRCSSSFIWLHCWIKLHNLGVYIHYSNIGGLINGSHCTAILLLAHIFYIFKFNILQIKNIIKYWIKYKQGGVIGDGMRKDPYTITIPADEQWDVTASLLTYEQSLRESGQPSEAMDIMILCDNIEQQIQQQSHDRRPPPSRPQE